MGDRLFCKISQNCNKLRGFVPTAKSGFLIFSLQSQDFQEFVRWAYVSKSSFVDSCLFVCKGKNCAAISNMEGARRHSEGPMSCFLMPIPVSYAKCSNAWKRSMQRVQRTLCIDSSYILNPVWHTTMCAKVIKCSFLWQCPLTFSMFIPCYCKQYSANSSFFCMFISNGQLWDLPGLPWEKRNVAIIPTEMSTAIRSSLRWTKYRHQ